jgi:hypothetical protein
MDNSIFIREVGSKILKQNKADLTVNYDLAILEQQMTDND